MLFELINIIFFFNLKEFNNLVYFVNNDLSLKFYL